MNFVVSKQVHNPTIDKSAHLFGHLCKIVVILNIVVAFAQPQMLKNVSLELKVREGAYGIRS